MQQALRALNDIYWKGLAPPGRLAPGAGTAAAAAAAAPVPPQQLPTAQLHSAQSSLHRGAAGAASVSRGRTATSTGRTSLPGASSSASSAPQAQAQQLNQVLTRLRQDWENNEVARTIQAVREKWVRERQEQLAARHHRRQQEMTNLVTAAQSAETREEIFAFDAQPGAKTYETLLMVQASEVDVEPARQHVEAILSLDQHPLTRRLIEGRRDLILRYYVPKDGPEGSSSVLAGSGDTVKEMLAETAQLLDQVALLLFDAYPDLLLNPATAPSPASAADAVHHDHQGAGGIGGAGGGGAASVGGAANPRSPQHDGTAADTASRFFTVKSLAQPFMVRGWGRGTSCGGTLAWGDANIFFGCFPIIQRRERAATGPPAPTAATVTSALASDMTDEEDLEDRRDAVRALVRKALQDFFFTEKGGWLG